MKKAIFSIKVKVKVTRSLTLLSFKRSSLVSMHTKYEVSISCNSKLKAKVKIDKRQRPTIMQTDRKDKTDNYAPDHLIRGHKNAILKQEDQDHNCHNVIMKLVFLD